MIEPTESEGLSELDRFCDTLIKIKEEIEKIKSGEFDKIDNPIKNAPHTDSELASDDWTHKYSRAEAAYPAKFLRANKSWPPVARVDNVYGDKNISVSYTHLRAHETDSYLVCRLLLEKKKNSMQSSA